MMRLAPGWVAVFIATLLGASHTGRAQTSSPLSAADCKRTVNIQKFQGFKDGPYVTDVGFSRSLHSCILVRVQAFGWKENLVHQTTDIFDVGTLRVIWNNGRLVPQSSNGNTRYPALAQEIRKLDIELAPR